MTQRGSATLRLLDRALGVPILAAFALAPKRRMPEPAAVRRIGVFKSAAIGDTLLLAGTFEALRARFPNAMITLVTGPDNAGAAPYFAGVIDEHVIVAPRRPLAAIRALRRARFDLLLECGPWPRVDALVGTLSGARFRVGYRVRGQARHFGFDRVVDHRSDVHQIENIRNLARAVGAERFGEARLSPVGAPPSGRLPRAPYVVFHPWPGGTRSYAREWPTERWVALGRALCDAGPTSIAITGSPADAARGESLAVALRGAGARAESIAGRFDISELGHVIVAADAVIAVNTGVMHLAALLGAPTVSLNGPTSSRRWGPVGPRARSVDSRCPGCGFLDLGYEYRGNRLDCMTGIDVADVLDALRW